MGTLAFAPCFFLAEMAAFSSLSLSALNGDLGLLGSAGLCGPFSASLPAAVSVCNPESPGTCM